MPGGDTSLGADPTWSNNLSDASAAFGELLPVLIERAEMEEPSLLLGGARLVLGGDMRLAMGERRWVGCQRRHKATRGSGLGARG